MSRTIAIFDLDKTLIAGDSAAEWIAYMCHNDLIKDVGAFYQSMMSFAQAYEAGNLPMASYIYTFVEPLLSLSEKQISKMANHFVEEKIRQIIYPSGEALLHHHRNQGDEILLISATVDFLVKPIGYELKLPEKNIIATEVEWQQGYLTGRYQGVPSYQHGKITRYENWLATYNNQFDYQYFYSDSSNDLPLLNYVTHPVATNPDDYLRAYAEKYNWSILDLAKSTG
jgi:HAD superfamily hydrolase (TIGR01490 family)